jgi:hypothetical protein
MPGAPCDAAYVDRAQSYAKNEQRCDQDHSTTPPIVESKIAHQEAVQFP